MQYRCMTFSFIFSTQVVIDIRALSAHIVTVARNISCFKNMPLCNFQTNLTKDKISEDFQLQLSEVISKTLDKPESKITVIIQPDLQMCKGGTNDPSCCLVVWSIGVFSAENNPKYATPIYHFITEKLGIPNERIMLLFHDLKPEELAKPQ